MRASLAAVGVLFALAAGTARADAVDLCPPGFQPSHSGCHFGPGPEDLGLCGGCACVIVGLGTFSALLIWRKSPASGPREGGA